MVGKSSFKEFGADKFLLLHSYSPPVSRAHNA